MQNVLLVGLGGFCGSILRYLLGGFVQALFKSSVFPWGTLGVNVLGCLLIGILGGLADNSGALSPAARIFILIGLLGGFTTFSSFSYESLSLLRDRELLLTLAYVSSHLVLGIGAAFIGYGISTLRG